MFDFDVGKLVVIGVVALIVIGPKDLPRVLRQVGQAVGKMRRMASEFQNQFMEAMREADVEDLKKEFEKTAEAAKIDVAFDPLKDVRDQITSAIEGDTTPGPALPEPRPEAPIAGDAASADEDGPMYLELADPKARSADSEPHPEDAQTEPGLAGARQEAPETGKPDPGGAVSKDEPRNAGTPSFETRPAGAPQDEENGAQTRRARAKKVDAAPATEDPA